ncbi:MAG: hypothetical protein HY481_00520 [Candidatus Vogelbacteria bacterium]|nr:hypothetical protein [Candidatus Vogelbacteria bacterium]
MKWTLFIILAVIVPFSCFLGRVSANNISATVNPTENIIFTVDTTQSFSTTLNNTNDTAASIFLPADVLSTGEEVQGTIESKDKSAVVSLKPIPEDRIAAPTIYDISFIKTSDSSPVSSFDRAITLTFTYTDNEITGINESTLKVYRWDGDSWVVLSDSSTDSAANTVTATTKNFSTFSLQGSATGNSEGSSGNAGGGSGGFIRRVIDFLTPLVRPAPTASKNPDLNGDGRVNLTDLSILLYHYEKPNPPAQYDLNDDGLVNLTDLSILFYSWK